MAADAQSSFDLPPVLHQDPRLCFSTTISTSNSHYSPVKYARHPDPYSPVVRSPGFLSRRPGSHNSTGKPTPSKIIIQTHFPRSSDHSVPGRPITRSPVVRSPGPRSSDHPVSGGRSPGFFAGDRDLTKSTGKSTLRKITLTNVGVFTRFGGDVRTYHTGPS